MGTIAEVTIPASEFALRETFEELADIRFEVARVVAHGKDRAMPFIWVGGDDVSDIGAVDEAFESDPSIENVRMLSDLGDERLYQMDWVDRTEFIIHVLVKEDATVLSAQGTNEEWHLRILFPTRDALSSTFEFSQNEGLTVNIEQIYELENAERGGQFGLTEGQYETLVTAHELGYYGIPRGITQEGLADELGISRQALSERFRRGHGRLVQNTLVIGTDANMSQGDIL